MKRIGKIVALLLAVSMVVAMFAGCAGAKGTTAGKGGLIGVAMPTKSLQRWNQDGDNMKKQLEAKGYTVDLQYAENDVNTQISQLEKHDHQGLQSVGYRFHRRHGAFQCAEKGR